MAERYAIAHVSPDPWEEQSELNAQLRELAGALRARGHSVLVLAPSHSIEQVRAGRALLAGAGPLSAAQLEEQLAGGEGFLALAQALGHAHGQERGRSAARRTGALAIDQSRALEALFAQVALDFVHVHEPLAPGLAAGALRHSHSLNVATFHSLPSAPLAQLARRLTEGVGLLGRLDGATAPYRAIAEALRPLLPAPCHLIAPGLARLQATGAPGAPPQSRAERGAERRARVIYCAREERAARRAFLRALRRLPVESSWQALLVESASDGDAQRPRPLLRESLRARLSVKLAQPMMLGAEIAAADIVVFASEGRLPDPSGLLGALERGGAVLASRIPLYEELLGEGQRGLLFEPGDIEAQAAQLRRLLSDEKLRGRLAGAGTRYARSHSFERAARETESLYRALAGRRHRPPARLKAPAQTTLIDVDLHMHTDHSPDCATPVELLLATARERGLGAIAVTDHNEISGALAASALSERYGVKVIVGEEVKTATEGEVIGLFLHEKIERGLTLAETIAQIKAQGGIVYVPHPFDRLHSIPDYANLLPLIDQIDALEVYNARVAISAFNDEAARFAAKYRIPAGAGSDAHVPQGLGSVRVRMADFDTPQEFLSALGAAEIIAHPKRLLYVQALKFIQTRTGGPPLRRLRGAARSGR